MASIGVLIALFIGLMLLLAIVFGIRFLRYIYEMRDALIKNTTSNNLQDSYFVPTDLANEFSYNIHLFKSFMNAVCVLLIIHRPKKSRKGTTNFAYTQVITINFYKKKNFLFYYTRTFLFYCLNSCIYAIFLLLLHPNLNV